MAFFEVFSSTDSTQRISASNDEHDSVCKHRDWFMSCACVRVDKTGLSFSVYCDAVYSTTFGCLIRRHILFYYELFCPTCQARGKVKVIKITIKERERQWI